MKKSERNSMILQSGSGYQTNRSKLRKALLMGAATASTAMIMPSYAQETGVDTMVVTAQKRTEDVQDVPVAITAFSADMLNVRGVSNPQDLQHLVPGLVFSDNLSGVGLVTLRGVGGAASRGSSPGRNPAVPVHVNGVYLQSPAIMLQDFLDVERVEVLRGPQGTLYGRNAVGGNINVITKRPTSELEGEVGVEIGNYDKRRVFGALSGPITDRLRGRAAFALEDRSPYVVNLSDPQDDEILNSDYSNVRLTLEYDVTDDVMVTVTGYDYRRDGASFTLRPRALPTAAGGGIFAVAPAGYQPASANDVQTVSHDTPDDGFDETTGVTGEINWDLGDVTFKSITGYFEMATYTFGDSDGTDLPNAQVIGELEQTYDTFSQELQLSSSGDGALTWLLGAYYYNESSTSDGLFDGTNTIINYLIDFTDLGDVESESYAVFGQGDIRLSDKLTVTLGIRYTHDEMEAERSAAAFAGGFPLFPAYTNDVQSESWGEVTWKAGLDYYLTEELLTYFSYSRGYKSGGFNLSDNLGPFDPEILDAFELGAKGVFFDRRMRINGAVYYYDYSDKQELTVDATGFSIFENAGAATIFGAELEMLAQLGENFVFDASVSYLNTEYDEYMSVDFENFLAGVQDLAGNELTEAPEWQIHVGAQYTHELGGGFGSLTLRADHSYTDEKFVRPFNLVTDRLDSYHRTNARLTWQSEGGAWEAEVYGYNLQNNDVINSFSETSPFTGFLHMDVYLPPRTYGFKLRYRF